MSFGSYVPRRVYSTRIARLRYSVAEGMKFVEEVTNNIAAKKKELFKPIRDMFSPVTITVRQGDGKALSVLNGINGLEVHSGAGITRVTITSTEDWKVTIATSFQDERKLYTGITVLNDRPHAVLMDPLAADAVAECVSALKQIEQFHDSEAKRIADENSWTLASTTPANAWWRR